MKKIIYIFVLTTITIVFYRYYMNTYNIFDTAIKEVFVYKIDSLSCEIVVQYIPSNAVTESCIQVGKRHYKTNKIQIIRNYADYDSLYNFSVSNHTFYFVLGGTPPSLQLDSFSINLENFK